MEQITFIFIFQKSKQPASAHTWARAVPRPCGFFQQSVLPGVHNWVQLCAPGGRGRGKCRVWDVWVWGAFGWELRVTMFSCCPFKYLFLPGNKAVVDTAVFGHPESAPLSCQGPDFLSEDHPSHPQG